MTDKPADPPNPASPSSGAPAPEPVKHFAHSTTGRILAIDYGTKRIGLAVTDPMGWFTVGLPTLDRAKLDNAQAVNAIVDACANYKLKRVVMGLPLHMDGSDSDSAARAREFFTALEPALTTTEGKAIPFEWVDERLSSMEAEDRLREQGIQPSRNKEMIDELAAKILLEPFLD